MWYQLGISRIRTEHSVAHVLGITSQTSPKLNRFIILYSGSESLFYSEEISSFVSSDFLITISSCCPKWCQQKLRNTKLTGITLFKLRAYCPSFEWGGMKVVFVVAETSVLAFGWWRRVGLYMSTNVSEENTTSIFRALVTYSVHITWETRRPPTERISGRECFCYLWSTSSSSPLIFRRDRRNRAAARIKKDHLFCKGEVPHNEVVGVLETRRFHALYV